MAFGRERFGEFGLVSWITFFECKGSFGGFGKGDVGESFVFTGQFIDDDFDLDNRTVLLKIEGQEEIFSMMGNVMIT